jgi:hypothetical protein
MGPVHARGRLLWLRAALLSAVAVAAGAVAHASAHGHLPGPVPMGILLAAGTLGSAPLLTRPAGPARIVALLVVGQTVVHAALTALAGHEGDEPAGHGQGPEWLHHLTEDLSGAHAAMAVAHAAAAALVGLWLAVGERALWALVAHAARVLLPRGGTPPVPQLPGAPPGDQTLLPGSIRLLGHTVLRRGPPPAVRDQRTPDSLKQGA